MPLVRGEAVNDAELRQAAIVLVVVFALGIVAWVWDGS